jgi:hypothetical protein
MLTPQEAFKFGFLARCVEERLAPEDMLAAVKVANDMLEKRANIFPAVGAAVSGGFGLGTKALDVARTAGESAMTYGAPLALFGPPAAGAAAGYGLAKLTDIDDTDVDEVKRQETIDELKLQADRLRRQKAVRDYQRLRQRSGRPF